MSHAVPLSVGCELHDESQSGMSFLQHQSMVYLKFVAPGFTFPVAFTKFYVLQFKRYHTCLCLIERTMTPFIRLVWEHGCGHVSKKFKFFILKI